MHKSISFTVEIHCLVIGTDLKNGKQYILSLNPNDIQFPVFDLDNHSKLDIEKSVISHLNQYIILNYDIPVYIVGIVTKGRATNAGQWVAAADVDVSIDGITWKRVLSNASLNTDYNSSVTNLFPSVEYAKYVKVMPTSWSNHITMRLGILIKQ